MPAMIDICPGPAVRTHGDGLLLAAKMIATNQIPIADVTSAVTLSALRGGVAARSPQGSIHGRSGHVEQFGQVGDGVVAGGAHAAQFGLLLRRQFGLSALQPTSGPSDGHAFAGAHPEQVDLELGEGGQDVEEHLAHRVGRVVDLTAQRQFDPAFGEVVADRPRVRDRPGQSVEFRHYEGVPGSDRGQGLIETRPGAGGAGESVVEVDPVLGDAELAQALPLCGQVLRVQRAARVTDEGAAGRHCRSVPYSRGSLRISSYHLCETPLVDRRPRNERSAGCPFGVRHMRPSQRGYGIPPGPAPALRSGRYPSVSSLASTPSMSTVWVP